MVHVPPNYRVAGHGTHWFAPQHSRDQRAVFSSNIRRLLGPESGFTRVRLRRRSGDHTLKDEPDGFQFNKPDVVLIAFSFAIMDFKSKLLLCHSIHAVT